MIVPAAAASFRVVMAFVENAVLGLGFDASAAMPLTLAAEEVFGQLITHLDDDYEVRISAVSGTYYARIDFVFRTSDLDLEALNMTACISPEKDIASGRIGLYLAARMVDRFDLNLESAHEMHLSLTKEKTYKERDDIDYVAAGPLDAYEIRRLEPEEAEVLGGLAYRESPDHIPTFFRFRGKTADMVRAGVLKAMGLFGPSGVPGGGLAWRWLGPRTVEMHGPYLFNQPDESEAGEALVDACLSALARTSCVCVIARKATRYLPTGHFQKLGDLESHPGHSEINSVTYFVLMGEDLGAVVWAHPDLADWLAEEYDRLTLARELQPVVDAATEGHSILAANLDKFKSRARLRPVLPGRDIAANVAAHLDLFKNENIASVYFFIDLGQAWQAQFVPALLEQGFTPELILPHAGRGDLVQFHLWTNTE